MTIFFKIRDITTYEEKVEVPELIFLRILCELFILITLLDHMLTYCYSIQHLNTSILKGNLK